MSITAMKQALEALEGADSIIWSIRGITPDDICEAITALRQAIEQAEKQEPVAWEQFHEHMAGPNYVAPQSTWVGLTNEEIAEVEDEYIVDYRIPAGSAWNFAKDIEAKLKEKNT